MKDLNRFVEHGQITNHEMNYEHPTDTSILVAEAIQVVSQQVTPIWDIRDHVAVNPFFGFKDKNFTEVSQYLKGISGTGIFPKKSYFLKQYERGEITDYDLETAVKLHGKSVSTNISLKDLIDYIKSSDIEIEFIKKKCLSDLFDQENKSDLTSQITDEVSKWAAAYFDEGQALWNIKDQQNLYSWWKSLIIYQSPFGLDKNKFARFIKELPTRSEEAIEYLTKKILLQKRINENELSDYYYRLIYTVLGWASFIKKFEFERERSHEISQREIKCKLVDILAIRMAYDLLFLDEFVN
ncbi:putative inorganic carbon transporter subunit DabA, partial [Bacteriovorax sp. DB6_IX]|uniref:putative inorganic carbon transporter subunit DabA n=1 Tax=Bacteriovorax sp. DB6_IX TaxID=1353530 RepID=UPI00038A0F96